MSDLLQVTGLWKNTSANGDTYLQGKLGPNIRILIFKNKFKTADNQPDYQIYFAPVERKDGEADGGTGAAPDDFFEESAPAPTPAPARPAPARAAAASSARPASAPTRPAGRVARQTPEPPPMDEFNDMDDPFAD